MTFDVHRVRNIVPTIGERYPIMEECEVCAHREAAVFDAMKPLGDDKNKYTYNSIESEFRQRTWTRYQSHGHIEFRFYFRVVSLPQ